MTKEQELQIKGISKVEEILKWNKQYRTKTMSNTRGYAYSDNIFNICIKICDDVIDQILDRECT